MLDKQQIEALETELQNFILKKIKSLKGHIKFNITESGHVVTVTIKIRPKLKDQLNDINAQLNPVLEEFKKHYELQEKQKNLRATDLYSKTGMDTDKPKPMLTLSLQVVLGEIHQKQQQLPPSPQPSTIVKNPSPQKPALREKPIVTKNDQLPPWVELFRESLQEQKENLKEKKSTFFAWLSSIWSWFNWNEKLT